jgi:very-short-patch-repair endonuclease
MVVNGIIKYQKVSQEKIELSRRLRKSMTAAECEFWKMVRGRRMYGLRFRRQQIVDGFIVDFYCNSLCLCVEIDGVIHKSEEQIKYDTLRTEALRLHGLKIIRFANEDVLRDKDLIRERLKELTSPPAPLPRERGDGGLEIS